MFIIEIFSNIKKRILISKYAQPVIHNLVCDDD
jgi:hypothetical protein